MAFPAIDRALSIMDANPPTASDDELCGIVVVPGLVSDKLSPGVMSSQPSAVTGSTSAVVVVASRSPSAFGRVRGRPRGRILPPAIKDVLGIRGRSTSVIRPSSSPSQAQVLSSVAKADMQNI